MITCWSIIINEPAIQYKPIPADKIQHIYTENNGIIIFIAFIEPAIGLSCVLATPLIFCESCTLNNWNIPARIGIIKATINVTVPALNIALGDMPRFKPKKLLRLLILSTALVFDEADKTLLASTPFAKLIAPLVLDEYPVKASIHCVICEAFNFEPAVLIPKNWLICDAFKLVITEAYNSLIGWTYAGIFIITLYNAKRIGIWIISCKQLPVGDVPYLS